jgi:hypothetical protein
VRQRELRHHVELFVDVEQLVADRRKHDAPDIGARQRGVEDVGVFGEPDAERGLRLRAERDERQQQGRNGDFERLHGDPPLVAGL